MENIISMNLDLQAESESENRAEKSTPKSKPNLRSGKARVGTKRAVKTPAECEVRLSILQAAFDQYLEAGGQAAMVESYGPTIRLFGVSVCGKCKLWTLEKACPVCG